MNRFEKGGAQLEKTSVRELLEDLNSVYNYLQSQQETCKAALQADLENNLVSSQSFPTFERVGKD